MIGRRFRAELVRVRTRRLTLLLSLVTALAAAMAVVTQFAPAGSQGQPPLDAGSFADALRGIPILLVGAVVLVASVLATAGDFHHRTITTVLLANPRRGGVVVAKALAAGATALGYMAVALAATAVTAGVWVGVEGLSVEMAWDPVLRRLAGNVGAAVVYALLGTGLGALVANQTAAITIAVLWVMGIEQAIVGILAAVGVDGADEAQRWLPGTVARVVARAATEADDLPLWGAASLFVVYAGVLALAGSWRLARRDIT